MMDGSDRATTASAALRLGDVQAQLGTAYNRFDSNSQALHLELLNGIRTPADVALDVRPAGEGRWTLAISAADAVGTLSIIAGLCTAFGVDIATADIFTIRVPNSARQGIPPRGRRRPLRRPVAPSRPQRLILDIFEVSTSTGGDLWGSFQQELRAALGLVAAGQADVARDQIIDRVSDALKAAHSDEGPLFPVDVQIDNEASTTSTKVSIRSVDSTGFLFEFTNALALLNVNIDRAEIRTVSGETRDTFLVTEASGAKVDTPARVDQLRVAAVLIKQFTLLLPRSPNPAQALRQFSALTRQLLTRPDWTGDFRDLAAGAVLQTLAELLGVSEFLWEDFLRMQHENLFPVLGDVPGLDARHGAEELRRELQQRLAPARDEDERRRILNEFKDREMFRIDLRHITGRIEFRAFAQELSALAEVVVDAAMSLVQQSLSPRHGHARLASDRPCGWVACALGKFGGRELGFASDIELLFVYEDDGSTDGPQPLRSGEYFDTCVRELLSTIVARREGIFEVDLRLRPYGNAGSLASSVAGLRDYYSPTGEAEQFERLALVKLRPVGGDALLGARVEEVRDAFVYSEEPLDVGNILHLRHRQATELVPYDEVSAKHSRGGVVDIEYFVQAKQIGAGARDASVRVTGTQDAIERLVAGNHIDASLGEQLTEAYSFLRRLIDGLRVVRGHAKDLTIPPRGSQAFEYLARRLRYESADDLASAIEVHMGFARGLWGVSD
jgi:glutamate-ammonia-ligase adenylyltransferase